VSSARFQSLLESFRGRRVAVVGDFLLDEYIIGDSSRVSREAPIVVVDYRETVHHPGGASNAAQNITSVGAGAAAVGVYGDDREGDTLVSLLQSKGVDTGSLVRAEGYATPLKLRILAGEMNAQKQQVARGDPATRGVAADAALARRLDEAAAAALESCDAALISDYGVGLVPGALSRAVIARGRERGIPVVVDSRFDLAAYAGATVATPNEVEALEAVGVREESRLGPGELGRRLREVSGIDQFVVTRGSQGMLVCATDSEGTIGIVGSREATDVTGAGDTVSALVTLSLASGASLEDAARMATYAAAVVVMKRGTATASVAELSEVIERYPIT
jgi:rfaE bifunctional protein kinase chain/domain